MSLSCKAATRGENQCKDRAVSNQYTIGTAKTRESWQACTAACSALSGCKAWTYNPSTKQCGLKKQATFIYQKGSVSGPVEGGLLQPENVDCSEKAVADNKYKCNYTIPDTYNLGEASFKTSWSECRSACNGDTECKAYTYTADGKCQKKKLNEYVALPNSGTVAGPRSGPLAGELVSPGNSAAAPTTSTSSTSSPSPSPSPTPTPAPENFLTTKSPLGLDWWIVLLIIALVVGGSSCMMMLVVVSSSSE